MRVSDIGARGKGRHTTVRRELVQLPGGAMLLDTPGLRGVGVFDLSEGLDKAFPEIEALAEQCRFADCSHASEPGCAVLLAVEDGRLTERRLDSWRRLLREAEWMATRGDARARSEARRKWVVMTKAYRNGVVRP